jgi:hypothetical protein
MIPPFMKTPAKLVLAGVMLAGLGAWFAVSAQETDDPLDSLKVCKDTQRLILENQFVRVIDDSIPPGVTEPMHRHRHGVVVYLSNYTTEQTTQDGKKISVAAHAELSPMGRGNRAQREKSGFDQLARDPD